MLKAKIKPIIWDPAIFQGAEQAEDHPHEELVNKVLGEFSSKHDWIPKPTIPVEELLELGLRYHVSYGDLGNEEGPGALGALYPVAREVRLDSSLEEKIEEQSLTFAHEIGHIVLHCTQSSQAGNPILRTEPIVCRPETSHGIENDAEAFAVRLLIPRRPLLLTIALEMEHVTLSVLPP